MLVNRVSDTFLFISIMLMWWYLGTTDYTIFLFNTKEAYYLDWICLTMMLGAAGKSAQIGLHTWLADAMEGSSRLEHRRPTHGSTFKEFYWKTKFNNNNKLINMKGKARLSLFLSNFSFTRYYSRNTYSITKSQWDNLLPIVLGCVLGGNAIRPPSSYIPSYITLRHNDKQILEIISKQMVFLLRENSQISLRKNFYYLHSKPLYEITNLFNLCYKKDTLNITRKKDNWVRNHTFLFNDLFVKFFNNQ